MAGWKEWAPPRKPKDPAKKASEIMVNNLSKTQLMYFSYCTPRELGDAVKAAMVEVGL